MKTRCLFHSLNEELASRLTVCYLETPIRLRGGVWKAVTHFSFQTLGSKVNPGRGGNAAPPLAQVLQDILSLRTATFQSPPIAGHKFVAVSQRCVWVWVCAHANGRRKQTLVLKGTPWQPLLHLKDVVHGSGSELKTHTSTVTFAGRISQRQSSWRASSPFRLEWRSAI